MRLEKVQPGHSSSSFSSPYGKGATGTQNLSARDRRWIRVKPSMPQSRMSAGSNVRQFRLPARSPGVRAAGETKLRTPARNGGAPPRLSQQPAHRLAAADPWRRPLSDRFVMLGPVLAARTGGGVRKELNGRQPLFEEHAQIASWQPAGQVAGKPAPQSRTQRRQRAAAQKRPQCIPMLLRPEIKYDLTAFSLP
jgi:hypothetical protein